MDSFREKQHECCCVGGLRCPCCNDLMYGHKNMSKLNRMARQKFKRETKELIKEGIDNGTI